MGVLNQHGSFDNSDGYSTDNSDVSMGSDTTENNSQVECGLLFDVDGVLARGSLPIDAAKQAMDKLKDSSGRLRVPVAYVTNACNRSQDKANQISKWFNIEVSPDQVIHAPTPAKLLTDLHHKHVLVIGQEHRREIAADLGFTHLCTIEDVKAAYPLLDMVDHDNRVRVAKEGYTENPDFPKVDAVLLIGEPKRWETDLQLLIDLLLTQGKPTKAPLNTHNVPQIPLIACNMDLVFMDRAVMPRFGHGAFLLCLEALYKKISGKELEYRNLVGKPSEITYRYAEHTAAKVARKMGLTRPLKRLYFFGDNPHVDIVGANLYNRFIRQKDGNANAAATELPMSRLVPDGGLHEQTVEAMHSMLVGTGVYKHIPDADGKTEETSGSSEKPEVYLGHRDIAHEPELTKPYKFVHDVNEGIDFILKAEGLISS